jgi:hypothetical protein
MSRAAVRLGLRLVIPFAQTFFYMFVVSGGIFIIFPDPARNRALFFRRHLTNDLENRMLRHRIDAGLGKVDRHRITDHKRVRNHAAVAPPL